MSTQDKSDAETSEDILDTTYAIISLAKYNHSGENQEVVQEGDDMLSNNCNVIVMVTEAP